MSVALQNIPIREAVLADLEKIVRCHQLAFPKTLSSRLGQNVSWKTLQWYVGHPKRFLLWIEERNRCVGYVGGMVSDGSQVHGSASSMIQHAFKDAVIALVIRPWLWFHPEILSRYKLILKNLYFKSIGYNKPMKNRKNHIPTEPHVGLVVIGVHPDSQGKGYGSLLLKAFERKVHELGYNKMSLTVLADNQPAIKSYSQSGWVIFQKKGKSVSMQKEFKVIS